jgi:polyphosphate kinase
VAPEALRPGLLDLIARESRRARKGKSAGISIKVNNLVDETIIDALYDASSAGVPIDLLVRGMCAIRPGVPGLSENIRVRSLLGRFLEHSRIFRFDSGGQGATWIGSADIMDRNLDRRVEALVRVRDPAGRRGIDDLLECAWSDKVDHWTLLSDGSWKRSAHGPDMVDYQQETIARRRRLRSGDDAEIG